MAVYCYIGCKTVRGEYHLIPASFNNEITLSVMEMKDFVDIIPQLESHLKNKIDKSSTRIEDNYDPNDEIMIHIIVNADC